jgi:hypothetical protein
VKAGRAALDRGDVAKVHREAGAGEKRAKLRGGEAVADVLVGARNLLVRVAIERDHGKAPPRTQRAGRFAEGDGRVARAGEHVEHERPVETGRGHGQGVHVGDATLDVREAREPRARRAHDVRAQVDADQAARAGGE